MSRRRGILVAGAAASIVVLAAGFVYLRGGSTPVSVEGAVQQFRAGSHATSFTAVDAPTAARPTERPSVTTRTRSSAARAPESQPGASGRPRAADGVYVYATTGGDDVDVLGGSRHVYPSRTTITVHHSGCSLIERWDVLKERWDERESCRTQGGDELRRMTSYHEFFRHGDTRTMTCKGFSYPSGDAPGMSWTMTCHSGNMTAATRLTAVAWEDVVVAGKRVRTLHVHASTRLTGEQQGSSERDVWGSSTVGLVVRERARIDSDSTQPVFGKTHYHEQYEIRLTSLQPQR